METSQPDYTEQAIGIVARELDCDVEVLARQMAANPKYLLYNGEFKVCAVKQCAIRLQREAENAHLLEDNLLMVKQKDALSVELAEARQAIREAITGYESLLTDKPMPDGKWPHLLICSGDRRVRPGIRGHSCCCKPLGWAERDALSVANQELREKGQALLAALVCFVGDPTTFKELKRAVELFSGAIADSAEGEPPVIDVEAGWLEMLHVAECMTPERAEQEMRYWIGRAAGRKPQTISLDQKGNEQ